MAEVTVVYFLRFRQTPLEPRDPPPIIIPDNHKFKIGISEPLKQAAATAASEFAKSVLTGVGE
jgi:hypothetical protein